jgi:putative endonuclease
MRWPWLNRFSSPHSLGRRGEKAAARFLKKLGYKIVARGETVRGVELDLVAVDRRCVVFVEVKTRQSDDAGHPADAIDENKRRRLTRGALGFLRRHGLLGVSARFDVVAVHWPSGRRRPSVEHFIDAFEAAGDGSMFG